MNKSRAGLLKFNQVDSFKIEASIKKGKIDIYQAKEKGI